MESRFNKALGLIGFSIISSAVAVLLLFGVLTGLHNDWFRMGLFFFLAVYMVDCCVGGLLNLKIDSCFTQLEELISSKSDSIRLRNPTKVVSIFLVVIAPLLLLLSMLAGVRQYWLMMGVLLSACTITLFISGGVMIALRINAYSRRLEELISRDKDDRASKEQSGE